MEEGMESTADVRAVVKTEIDSDAEDSKNGNDAANTDDEIKDMGKDEDGIGSVIEAEEAESTNADVPREFGEDVMNRNVELDKDVNNGDIGTSDTVSVRSAMNDLNDRDDALNGNDKNDSDDSENQTTIEISNIKSEVNPDMQVVVLNKHNKYNARQKPDVNSLRHECESCDEAFQYPYQLARHKKVKHEGKYPYHCKLCSKPFDRRSSLRDHMYVHSEERLFPCKLCDKSFKMVGNLRKHLREMHMDVQEGPKLKFQCEYCSKIFPTKQRLTSHFVCHDPEKAFACDICGKKFNRKNNLKNHQLLHSSEKNFKCPDCHMCFNRSYSLKIHSRNHMAVKPYKCELCPSSFSQLHALKTHFRLHTGEKPFKCTVCPQTFRQLATLQVHLKRHSGVKDFKCMVCGRAFVIKRRLTEHMRLHTGEKPFACELCPHKTATSSGLRLHNKTHIRQMKRSALKMSQGINESGDTPAVGKKRKSAVERSSQSVSDNSLEVMTKLAESEFDTNRKVEDAGEVEIGFKITDNDLTDTGESIAMNSNEVETSECTIEMVNDAVYDTNVIDAGTGTTEQDSLEMIGATHEAECTNDETMIGVKFSDVRSTANVLNENVEADAACENSEAMNIKSTNPITLDFKFSASEILYKHLNDLIPTIDAGILSDKIDSIVKELADIHEVKNNESTTRKVTQKKPKRKSAKSVKSRLNVQNQDMSSTQILPPNSVENTLPFTKTNNVTQPMVATLNTYQDMNNIFVKTEPVDNTESAYNTEPRAGPMVERRAIPRAEPRAQPKAEPSADISEIQASHRTLSLSLLSGHESMPVTPPVTIKREPMDIPEVGNSQSSSEDFTDTYIKSTLRKMLMMGPSPSQNNVSTQQMFAAPPHYMNTSQNHGDNSLTKSLLSTKPASSNVGNTGVLREILSKPPQYMLASRNSVAALQHARKINSMKPTNSINQTPVNDFDNGMSSFDFPWVSIDNVKLEPLSGDEN